MSFGREEVYENFSGFVFQVVFYDPYD